MTVGKDMHTAPKAIKINSQEDLKAMFRNRNVVRSLRTYIEREMRMLWNIEANLLILDCADETHDWYCGTENAPVPKTLLSTVLRPAGDEDKRGAHRLMAFVRATSPNQPTDTLAYMAFKMSSLLVLERLREVRRFPVIDEAERTLEEWFAYIENAARKGLDTERFARRMEEKAKRYIELCWQITKAFETLEREIMGLPTDDARCDAVEAAVEKVGEDVRRLLKRERGSPASRRTQDWVMAQWEYFSRHPEACAADKRGKRVYVRDVWECVRTEATERYGIADMAAFARIRRAAVKNRERRGTSEE